MSGEGTAPSKHGRKPEKDTYTGKPEGSDTAKAKDIRKGNQSYKNCAGKIKGKRGGY